MANIEAIEGIGPALGAKLADAGVKTCEQLLELGGTRRGRIRLAEKSGISEAQILKFVNAADLMRVKGVGGEYAELLECAGVDSMVELGHRNAANLTATITAVNLEKKLVRTLPAESQVEDWIQQARKLPQAVTH